MDLNLTGKKALVTGASTGLGFEAALALIKEGAVVTINSRNSDNLEKAADKIEKETSARPLILTADLSDHTGLELTEKFIEKNPIDILISNTGGPPAGQFIDLDQSEWDKACDLILNSALNLTRFALKGMIERKWGRLIYITSVSVLEPINDLILSNSYRAAVTGMCKTVSNNYAAHGITANCVCPGYTATDRLNSLVKRRAEEAGVTSDEIIKQFSKSIPAGRLGQPDELASLIAFLASDKAAYITGVSIPVDGGLVKGLI